MDARVLTRDRSGFTMIEVMVAMVILGIAVLGVQAVFTDRFVRDMGRYDRETVATQLVEDQIQVVQLHPVYATLEERYGRTESSIPGFPGFTRETTIQAVKQNTARGVVDFKRVTVTVRGNALPRPVSRTIVVGAP